MLKEFERAVLLICCRELHQSKSRHLSEHAIIKRLPGAEREARKALKKLVSKGYIGIHPTRGEMTYQLTQLGFMECQSAAKGPK